MSVILPVYNGLPYLKEAISSILSQSFLDFELIIIDDGSTDDSGDVARSFHDPRVQFYRQQNKGLAATLNWGISICCGEYIARQDQDDVSFPLRFERQIEFMRANPEVGILGSAAEIWVGNEHTNRVLRHPTDDVSLRFAMLFNNYFVHSSMMIRRTVFQSTGYYSEDKGKQPPEDYELWSRVMRKFKIANLSEILMAYREIPSSMSRSGVSPFLVNLERISAENLSWATGQSRDSPAIVALSKLHQGDFIGIPKDIRYKELKELVGSLRENLSEKSNTPLEMLRVERDKMNRQILYKYIDYRTGGLIAFCGGMEY
ncbi:MAG: glycosyltransferase [Rhodoferax sp.]|nr:glycosyltransferase [Rhodoferax sp.]